MLGDTENFTRQRREILRWLNDRAPSFSDAYQAAVRLLYTPAFPARVHLVCHIVRDIYRTLPAALGALSLPRPFEVLPTLARELASNWEKFPASLGQWAGRPDSDVPVTPQVYHALVKLIDKSRGIADQPSVGKHLAVALYRSADRHEHEFLPPWIIKCFDSEYDYFVKRAHLAKSVSRVPTDEGLAEHFEAFERAFHSLVGSYFTGKEELDAILQETNAGAG